MVASRLPADDDIGREMVENVLEQAESIGQALSLLSHDPDEDEEGQDGEGYYEAVGEEKSGSSSSAVIDVSVIGNGTSGSDSGSSSGSSSGTSSGSDTLDEAGRAAGEPSFSQPQTRSIGQDTARRRDGRDSSVDGNSSSSSSSGRDNSDGTLSDDFWSVNKEEIAVDYPINDLE